MWLVIWWNVDGIKRMVHPLLSRWCTCTLSSIGFYKPLYILLTLFFSLLNPLLSRWCGSLSLQLDFWHLLGWRSLLQSWTVRHKVFTFCVFVFLCFVFPFCVFVFLYFCIFVFFVSFLCVCVFVFCVSFLCVCVFVFLYFVFPFCVLAEYKSLQLREKRWERWCQAKARKVWQTKRQEAKVTQIIYQIIY